MNQLQIEYFLALVKHGSFRKTADAFYISPPAVSMQIARLEQEWGVKLFSREYRNVTLTQAGRILYDALNAATENFRAALAQAQQLRAGERCVVTIGVPEYAEFGNLLDIVASYQQEHPNVLITVESVGLSELLLSKSNQRFDMIISLSHVPSNRRQMSTLVLSRRHNMAFIAKDHPLVRGRDDWEMSDLKELPIYVPSSDNEHTLTEYCRDICLKEGFSPEKLVVMPNVASMLMAVKMGQGVAVLDDLITVPASFGLIGRRFQNSFNVNLSWRTDGDKPFLGEIAKMIQENTDLDSVESPRFE